MPKKRPSPKDKLEGYFPAPLKKKYKKALKGMTVGHLKSLATALKAQNKYAKAHREEFSKHPCTIWL